MPGLLIGPQERAEENIVARRYGVVAAYANCTGHSTPQHLHNYPCKVLRRGSVLSREEEGEWSYSQPRPRPVSRVSSLDSDSQAVLAGTLWRTEGVSELALCLHAALAAGIMNPIGLNTCCRVIQAIEIFCAVRHKVLVGTVIWAGIGWYSSGGKMRRRGHAC